jgi:hypothetical protein
MKKFNSLEMHLIVLIDFMTYFFLIKAYENRMKYNVEYKK